ncbi:hypothetical protein SLA2020_170550 [Shorea laevis]
MVKKNPSFGRQKIAIEKIQKKSCLQVTFSKRTAGLFKKASELCTLCGVEIGIVVFSPANTPFSFGHPQVESLFERFLTRNPHRKDSSRHDQLIESNRDAHVCELNFHLTQLLNQLEVEKKQGEAFDRIQKEVRRQCWWAAPIEELGVQQLEQLRAALQELKKNVGRQINQILYAANSSTPDHNGYGNVCF